MTKPGDDIPLSDGSALTEAEVIFKKFFFRIR